MVSYVGHGDIVVGLPAVETLRPQLGQHSWKSTPKWLVPASARAADEEHITDMVQEAPFQEEMDQSVERVPNEEESISPRSCGGQCLQRRAISHEENGHSRGQGNEGDLVEEVRGEAMPDSNGIGDHFASFALSSRGVL